MKKSKFFVCFSIIFAGSLLALTDDSIGALKSSKATATAAGDLTAGYNPNPMKDDIVLPMPAGYSMVFRAVVVPAKNALYDRKFLMGLTNNENSRTIYERRMEGYISAPFERKDLPKNWLVALPQKEDSGYFYYFLGKYEISQGQWHAVMGGEKPARPELPQANISWYDLQAFLQKYNEWLMRNHAAELPMSEGMPGYLRLPTEEEWEFAARGGNLPPEKMNFQDFPLEEGKKLSDYGTYGSNYSDAMPIGRKQPNCLGLYDMIGNLAEMVQSPFRFTVSEYVNQQVNRRLHGSQGGLISKGGSFVSSNDNDVLPGKRNELRMFVKAGNTFEPFKARFVGSRLVIASINVPGAQRQREIEAALKQASYLGEPAAKPVGKPSPSPAVTEKKVNHQKPAVTKEESKKKAYGEGKERVEIVQIDQSGNLMTELDKVIKSTGSPIMQSNLYQLRDLIEDNNAALERERDANMLNTLRSAVFEADSLRNLGYRVWSNYDTLIQFSKSGRAKKEQLEFLDKEVDRFYGQLSLSSNFYLNTLREVTTMPEREVSQKIAFLKSEYSGSDAYNKSMRRTVVAMEKHIAKARKTGVESLDLNSVWKDIMYKDVYEALAERARTKAKKTNVNF